MDVKYKINLIKIELFFLRSSSFKLVGRVLVPNDWNAFDNKNECTWLDVETEWVVYCNDFKTNLQRKIKSISDSDAHVVSILRNWLVLLSFFVFFFSFSLLSDFEAQWLQKRGAIKRMNIFMITGFQEKSIFFRSNLLRCFVLQLGVRCACVMWCWINTAMTRAVHDHYYLRTGTYSEACEFEHNKKWTTTNQLSHTRRCVFSQTPCARQFTLIESWQVCGVKKKLVWTCLYVCLFARSFVHTAQAYRFIVCQIHISPDQSIRFISTQQFKREQRGERHPIEITANYLI